MSKTPEPWHVRFRATLEKLALAALGAIIVILLTAAIGFLLWWLRLSPESTRNLPLTQGNPVQVYGVWFGTFEALTCWRIDDIDSVRRVFAGTQTIKSGDYDYDHYFPAAVPATLVGNAELAFDIENTDKLSQANLDQMFVEVERESATSVQDIFAHIFYAGGPGEIRMFEAIIKYDDSPSAQRLQTIPARPAKSAGFDFIALKPGERERIGLAITFSSPGLYHVRPIAKFSYRNQQYRYQFEGYDVLVPELYRIWSVQDGLKASPVVVNRVTGKLQFEGQVANPAIPPILFESTMVNSVLSRVFIVDGNSMTSPILGEPPWWGSTWKPRWSGDGSQVIYDDWREGKNSKTYALNLLTGKTSELGPIPTDTIKSLTPDLERMIEAKYGKGKRYGSISASPRGDLLAVVIIDGTIYSHKDSGQIVLLDMRSPMSIEVRGASAWCTDPSWSPSGKRLAFICIFDSNGNGTIEDSDQNELWVADTKGATTKISPSRGIYWQPVWSKDEKQILVGGNGLRIFQSNAIKPPLTILETPLGYFFNQSWKPR